MINKNLLENFITDKEEYETNIINKNYNFVTTFILGLSIIFITVSCGSESKIKKKWYILALLFSITVLILNFTIKNDLIKNYSNNEPIIFNITFLVVSIICLFIGIYLISQPKS